MVRRAEDEAAETGPHALRPGSCPEPEQKATLLPRADRATLCTRFRTRGNSVDNPRRRTQLMDPDRIQALFRALTTEGVEYVLVGPVALDVIGIGRLTHAIDPFGRPSAEIVARLQRGLPPL